MKLLSLEIILKKKLKRKNGFLSKLKKKLQTRLQDWINNKTPFQISSKQLIAEEKIQLNHGLTQCELMQEQSEMKKGAIKREFNLFLYNFTSTFINKKQGKKMNQNKMKYQKIKKQIQFQVDILKLQFTKRSARGLTQFATSLKTKPDNLLNILKPKVKFKWQRILYIFQTLFLFNNAQLKINIKQKSSNFEKINL
ncbi:unnamed protein product [Paramecium sonneborni]|uniref:Uncharacterized protein n=1 Tax=Paramecium sonneborni TaxID=65129 RepID=A0A8S1N3E3_9CILI|nr:unnamed protein product [Paramecium sonneborni]